jgi:hypothetical protein
MHRGRMPVLYNPVQTSPQLSLGGLGSVCAAAKRVPSLAAHAPTAAA